MLKLNKNYMLDDLNHEWFNALDKIHDELLDWVEDEINDEHTKVIENDRKTGVTSLIVSLIFNYATNNRNKDILVVSTNGLGSKNMYNAVNDLFESTGVYSSTKNTITIFNGTVIEFISQDKHLAKEYDLCVFDSAMRISYSNYGNYAPFTKKRIITFTSGMLPLEEVNKTFLDLIKIEIPFTIKGMADSLRVIEMLQVQEKDFKNQGYILGCKKLKEMFKDIL